MENNLLVSTDCTRYTLYQPLNKQKDLSHYYDIVQNSISMDTKNTSFIFDHTKNLNSKFPEFTGEKIPNTIVHCVRPINGYDNSIKGAVIVTISGDILESVIKKSAPEELGAIFLFNNDGLILSHTDSEYIGKNILELDYSDDLLGVDNIEGHFLTKSKETSAVVSFQQSEVANWMYVSVTRMEDISSTVFYIQKIIMLIAILSIFIGFAISYTIAKRLAKPIQSIAEYCQKSKYAVKQTKNNNEYSLISNTLNNLESIMDKKKKEFEMILPMLEMNLLSSIFSSNPPSLQEINDRTKILDIRFPFEFFCAAAIKLERIKDCDKVVEFELEKLNIISQFDKSFTTKTSTCLLYEKNNIISILLNFDTTEENLYHLGQTFLGETFNNQYQNVSICKYLSFGKIVTNIQCVNASFQMALNGLNYSYIFPERNLFVYRDIIIWEQNASFPNKLLLNNLKNSLKSLNQKKCISDLALIVKELKNGNYSYQQILNTLVLCTSLISDFLYSQTTVEIDLEQTFSDIINIIEYEKWLQNIINSTFNNIGNTSSDRSELIKKALAIMEENVRNPQLSLEYVANELGVSYKYLSKLFKYETGVSFMNYSTNLKLSYCRNLLINTDLMIGEISNFMGYSTPQYFIKRFKILFGCTPGKYREKHVRDT